MRIRAAACLAGALAVIVGTTSLGGQTGSVTFKDVTAAAGITFVHNSGRSGKKYLPETMGAGGAFVDLDGDGWLDIVIVNSRDWAPKAGTASVHGLYRNNRNGTFTDVVKGSGLDQSVYGMGVAAGDVDNDGDEDLYVTALEGDRLYRNDGGFKFTNVTRAAGLVNANFGTSAAFVDYDRDGALDLFVANYVQVVRGHRQALCARRQEQVVLHARGVSRRRVETLSQSGRGPIRRREPEGGRRQSRRQGARGRARGLRRRRVGRPVCRQRHAAQPVVPQQPQRHVLGHGRGRRRRVLR